MDWLLGLTNAYDVMGLAPDATEKEIEDQFDLLVARKGYRIGMRRGSWRQRLAEIKSAYATLSDPAKRQAYDQSLGIPSAARAVPPAPPTPPAHPWAFGAASDTSTDSLVQPASILRTPIAKANRRKISAKTALKTNGLPLAAGRAPEKPAALGVAPKDESPRSGNAPQMQTAPAEEPHPRAAERLEPTLREDSDQIDFNEEPANRRGSVKTMAVGGALAVGVGAVLFASWQQPPSRELAIGPARPPASAEHIRAGGAAGSVSSANLAGLNASSAISQDGKAAAAGDQGAPSASLSQPLAPQGSGATGSSASAKTDGPAEAKASKDASVNWKSASKATQAPAPVVRLQVPAQAEPQAAKTVTAAVSPIVPLPRANQSSSIATPQVDLSRPSRWISGGPSDADNKRGRYRGSVDVQLVIGAEGRVTNCSVARTSGNSELDALTCRIVQQRSRFTPAQDAQGRAASSRANATYVWGRGHRSKK